MQLDAGETQAAKRILAYGRKSSILARNKAAVPIA